MQYQMSGAAAPSTTPRPEAPGLAPELVRSTPPPPRRSWMGIVLVALVVAGGAAWWLWPQPQTSTGTPAGAAAVRTTTVRAGGVYRTIRLSGTTGAEKYSSLVVPQLRASRGDGLREARNFTTPGANYTVTSNARGGSSAGSTGGGSVSSGSGTGTSGTGQQQVASTMGQSSNTTGGSAALRSATSRVSRGSNTGSRSTSSTSSSQSGNSGTIGGDLGSTSSQLMGGGTGGGGGSTGGGGGGGGRGGGASEFHLVLQDAAKPGAHIKKGDVVAEFDRQYMLNRLEDYHASVGQMQSSFKKLEAELAVQRKSHAQTIENAKADLDKARLDLKTTPVLGTMDTERVRLAAEEAEARYKQLLAEVKFVDIGYKSQLRNAELELQQASVELKRAENNANRMLLRAPINGLVVMQTMFRGTEMAQIQPGDQLWPGMMFMQIVDPSSMVINATVNQTDVDTIRIGAKAKVRFDAYPELELPAHVHAIGAMTKAGGQRAAFVKEVPVQLKLDDMDPRVIPDLSVSADVILEAEEQAPAVAALHAVFYDDGTKSSFVYVKNGDGWERRSVETGLATNVAVVIRSGLRPGEVLAAEHPPAASAAAVTSSPVSISKDKPEKGRS